MTAATGPRSRRGRGATSRYDLDACPAEPLGHAAPAPPSPMTAARRSGGRPPSHSHCSITQGQMRSVTAAASCAAPPATRGKVSGRPARMRTLCGRMRQPLRIASVPMTADGDDRGARLQRQAADAALGRPSAPGRMRVPSGKIRTVSPRARIARAVSSISSSPLPRSTGNAPSALSNQPCQLALEQLPLGDVVQRPAGDRRDHEWVQERAVVGRDDHRPLGGDVLAADARQAEVDVEERLEDRPDEPVDDRLHALLPGALVQCGVRPSEHLPAIRVPGPSLQSERVAADRTILRGALAGAAAAGVWAAQQPLDKRVFGVDYDDAELLGAVIRAAAARSRRSRRPRAAPAQRRGLRRRLRGRLPAPSAAGPGPRRARRAWPSTSPPGRSPVPGPLHPAGAQFPQLWGDRRAFAQATWRHVLFGACSGARGAPEPAADEAAPADEDHSSTNGHGNVEHLVVARA